VRVPVQVLATLLVVALMLVGCGGSDSESVNGCTIEPGTQCADVDLSGADLSGADLSRAVLTGANLEGTNLSEADLSEADLSGAQIVDTDLSDADLTSANLTDADISGANLEGATLCGTTRTDGTVDDTSCPASTETTGTETTETTETTEAAEAEVTSFDLSDLDCGSATTGPVTVTWETENATAVEIAVDTASPTSGGPSGSTTVVVACDGNPHAVTITPENDSGRGVPDTKEVSSG
jgi:pentapeptide repeat protein